MWSIPVSGSDYLLKKRRAWVSNIVFVLFLSALMFHNIRMIMISDQQTIMKPNRYRRDAIFFNAVCFFIRTGSLSTPLAVYLVRLSYEKFFYCTKTDTYQQLPILTVYHTYCGCWTLRRVDCMMTGCCQCAVLHALFSVKRCFGSVEGERKGFLRDMKKMDLSLDRCVYVRLCLWRGYSCLVGSFVFASSDSGCSDFW